ncbi:hypothetical protein CEXT_506441 [Caerostris extrusa]|uniref:Uncharacterized protein n=1 Tax=Caerostris extrusa TaxID=172846 RepID=A0AAV4QSW0_CAEEX|nr:hypothetical protein CEXT_506441 [Caerostris extrusa]
MVSNVILGYGNIQYIPNDGINIILRYDDIQCTSNDDIDGILGCDDIQCALNDDINDNHDDQYDSPSNLEDYQNSTKILALCDDLRRSESQKATHIRNSFSRKAVTSPHVLPNLGSDKCSLNACRPSNLEDDPNSTKILALCDDLCRSESQKATHIRNSFSRKAVTSPHVLPNLGSDKCSLNACRRV